MVYECYHYSCLFLALRTTALCWCTFRIFIWAIYCVKTYRFFTCFWTLLALQLTRLYVTVNMRATPEFLLSSPHFFHFHILDVTLFTFVSNFRGSSCFGCTEIGRITPAITAIAWMFSGRDGSLLDGTDQQRQMDILALKIPESSKDVLAKTLSTYGDSVRYT